MTKNGASWSDQPIDGIDYVGHYTAIALSNNGNPNISYYDETNSALKFANKSSGTWNKQTIESSGYVGSGSSVAMDQNNNPHVSYYNPTNNSLKYAKWNGASWDIQTVDSTGGFIFYYSTLKLDSNGNPCICYYSSNSLKYAKWNNPSWELTTLAQIGPNNTGGDVGARPCIAIDKYNNPNIAYYDLANKSLKYMRTNNNPIITWEGEAGYLSDGVDPDIGVSSVVLHK